MWTTDRFSQNLVRFSVLSGQNFRVFFKILHEKDPYLDEKENPYSEVASKTKGWGGERLNDLDGGF